MNLKINQLFVILTILGFNYGLIPLNIPPNIKLVERTDKSRAGKGGDINISTKNLHISASNKFFLIKYERSLL